LYVNTEKKLFLSKCISDDIKSLSKDICDKNNILIKYIETDKDHIHYMIETIPNISISKIVKLIKSHTTYHIWKNNYSLLKKYYWKDKTFWTDGYFVSSIMDGSWNILLNQLKYKSEWYGRKYVTVDKFYSSSQICSNCGYKNSNVKDLSIRIWDCPNCNVHHNRDINAAINILHQGLQLV
jgi:putative transposase